MVGGCEELMVGEAMSMGCICSVQLEWGKGRVAGAQGVKVMFLFRW